MSVKQRKNETTLAPHELLDGDHLRKLLRAVEGLDAQIKNRPLSVWEMRLVAASTMEYLEKMADKIVVPEFTPVD